MLPPVLRELAQSASLRRVSPMRAAQILTFLEKQGAFHAASQQQSSDPIRCDGAVPNGLTSDRHEPASRHTHVCLSACHAHFTPPRTHASKRSEPAAHMICRVEQCTKVRNRCICTRTPQKLLNGTLYDARSGVSKQHQGLPYSR